MTSGETNSDEQKNRTTEPVTEGVTRGSKAMEEPVLEKNESEPRMMIDRTDREISFSRRALLQAGWIVPVVFAVGLPKNIYAGSPAPSPGHIDLFPSPPPIHIDLFSPPPPDHVDRPPGPFPHDDRINPGF